MISYEQFHLNKENRRTGKFKNVLHPDFKEFGQSGNIYVTQDFPDSISDNSEYEIKHFSVTDLSKESRLCTYLLLNTTKKQASNRSSVWIVFQGEWKLIFHQGTRTEYHF
ncbi:hypothetical protein [Corticicoccus populi]|uniref:DUF4440 domain-containing protein n=1 Tax=Corticicoccus populi TaxID=1812821 RepID=A0ABW5WUF5_9STAP